MPLVYGEDSSTARPLSRLTWIALAGDAVLVGYWIFYIWASESDDLPDYLRGDGGYAVFGSLIFAFLAAVVTVIVAVAGLRADRKRNADFASKIAVAVVVLSLVLNPAIALPVLAGLLR